jgi:hypothetical protein
MINVFGEGVDAVITINLLLKAGAQVTHHYQSGKFGGHFRGIDTCGGSRDSGLMLLEPDFIPGTAEDFDKYDGEFGRNSRVYLEEVFDWLKTQLGNLTTHEVVTMLPSHKLVGDYFIGDCLEFLNTLNLRQRKELEERLILFLNDVPNLRHLHPANKLTSELASKIPLSEFLEIIYGPEVYALYFKGFLEKVTGSDLTFISSRDNRRVWMPNFYPESILFALNQAPEYRGYELNPLRFLRPESGSIADFVQSLQFENETSRNYRKHKIKLEEFKFDFNDRDSVYFIHLNDLPRNYLHEVQFGTLFAKRMALYNESHFIDITHFCVAEIESRTVFVADELSQVIRYSYYSDQKGGSISVESISGDLDPKVLALQILATDNFEATCGGHSQKVPIRIKQTNFPMKEWSDFSDRFKSKYPNLNQSIFLIHPEANSFNDNLLRGLVAFRRRDL